MIIMTKKVWMKCLETKKESNKKYTANEEGNIGKLVMNLFLIKLFQYILITILNSLKSAISLTEQDRLF